MNKTSKILGLAAIYVVVAVLIVLVCTYFYRTNDFFRSLFEGNVTAPTQMATENPMAVTPTEMGWTTAWKLPS